MSSCHLRQYHPTNTTQFSLGITLNEDIYYLHVNENRENKRIRIIMSVDLQKHVDHFPFAG